MLTIADITIQATTPLQKPRQRVMTPVKDARKKEAVRNAWSRVSPASKLDIHRKV